MTSTNCTLVGLEFVYIPQTNKSLGILSRVLYSLYSSFLFSFFSRYLHIFAIKNVMQHP